MISDTTRREFLKFFRLASAAGFLPAELLPQGPRQPSPATPLKPTDNSAASEAMNSLAKAIGNHIDDLNSTSNQISQSLQGFQSDGTGPVISAQQGPAMPYIPSSGYEPELELDGYGKDDLPANYNYFNTQTGLFGESGEAALPVGFSIEGAD